MIFGITVTLITIAAVVLAFLPALRASLESSSAGSKADFEHDLAVYKDQLVELQSEIDRGVISVVDAKQARAEIARRLLAAETKIQEFDDAAGSIANRKFGSIVLVAVAAVFVPAIAALTYSTLGSPSMETQPLAVRVLAEQNTQVVAGNDGAQIRDLVERAEAHLQANPNDGRGWEVLAPIYFRLGRGEEARAAYANAIRMLGENGSRLSGMGEVDVAIAGGVVNEAA
ncbi:MAG: c-type cytochrome biogenesis protein CcmI, partial [Pseudomonadota bacterium]